MTAGRVLHACGIASLLAFSVVRAEPAHAEREAGTSQRTTAPLHARYEVVQSALAARWTFLLDRFTGRVSQLVRTTDDRHAWEAMPVAGLPSLRQATRPRFQIFTSGHAARYTFLIDTDTGRTWSLAVSMVRAADGSEREVAAWQTVSAAEDRAPGGPAR